MSILDSRYDQLRPELEYLSDTAVLVQAWKKSDAYIRRHNWYSDVLSLEKATVALPFEIEEWSKAVCEKEYAPRRMRLVPAPKNTSWHFPQGDDENGWCFKPDSEGDKQKLRPLAHVGIREQTIATSAMLCLADAVETVQGNTDQPDYKAAQRDRVYSYGNRLFCDWSETRRSGSRARHRWGSSNTYSRFYQDYQRFLTRPAEVCKDWSTKAGGGRLFVVKLDLSQFYDRVDRARLVEETKKLYAAFIKKHDLEASRRHSAKFWMKLRQVLEFQWSANDQRNLASLLDRKRLPKGLPQGLVASGFLANAYLHRFDQNIGGFIRRKGTKRRRFRVLDYCRYVDDMRLVVLYPADVPTDNVQDDAANWINGRLAKYCEGLDEPHTLEVNARKTEAVAWEDFAVQGRMSEYMRGVQSNISTVPDVETLQTATSSLNHLLWLSDALADTDADVGNHLALSKIAVPQLDVRDDTIKRFAANRLLRVLRQRRSMASPDVGDTENAIDVSEQQALDHEMETTGRKLVACWARNPSLVTVLRCGLDMFPSPELLTPVLEALKERLAIGDERERCVAAFVLADLLRAGATETGYRSPEVYPKHSDVDGFRSCLRDAALEALADDSLPWFVHQQAALALAVQQRSADIPEGPELALYHALHRLLRNQEPKLKNAVTELAVGVVVYRLSRDEHEFAARFGRLANRVDEQTALRLVTLLIMIDASLVDAVARAKQGESARWSTELSSAAPPPRMPAARSVTELGSQEVPLLSIVGYRDNPFQQENALLKLCSKLLASINQRSRLEDLSLSNIVLDDVQWDTIQDPTDEDSFKVVLFSTSIVRPEVVKQMDEVPPWCAKGMGWAYSLGKVLRAAIIGSADFTDHYFAPREGESPYRGLRTTWFKRRVGLTVITEGFGSEPTPISPWVNSLVLRLLQWPGLGAIQEGADDFDTITSPSELAEVVKARLQAQGYIYARLSRLPVYELPIEREEPVEATKFRVALVQTLMPRAEDFSKQDPTTWTPSFRARHRSHLATLCRLVHKVLEARASATANPVDVAGNLDLIVFPELSVHPNDILLLRSLSDTTKAAIFAGQTFVTHSALGLTINRALWMLRYHNKSGRQIACVYQGKEYMTEWESKCGVSGYRPFQVLVRFKTGPGLFVSLSGAICYDATDLRLAADMRDVSDGFVIPALNKDINTFDTLAGALQYHMYQPVIVANTGQYGGSTAQAPYKEHYHRLITHLHGADQAAVSIFEIDLDVFKHTGKPPTYLELKWPPAGYDGR